ncbi:alpha/beta hydrolase [Pseudonocardia spinosispora]|uniref:alpha/beta hydrolase n=1 Tax=Pseudonocardia spinosispora TaxID=103441 RepID=UPI0009FD30F5|nr:alpha/beta hydrolase [Pseudonocardia spinosispora]
MRVAGEPGSSRGRRSSVRAAALAVMVLATACGPTSPSGLDRFYAQRLSWTPCDSYECASLVVPIDYGRPDGATARLAVLRQPATQPSRRIGSLVINPGGPGFSGTDAAADTAENVGDSEVARRFDIVGFDPRGVGESTPAIRCLTPAERDAERQADARSDNSPAGVERQEAHARDFAAKCAQRSGVDLLANAGTRDVVRDMDILRAALGDEKLTYAGFSYGTRLGYSYAESFPARVRALVLDGALDPDENPLDRWVAQGAGFQQAFDAFARWCTGQPRCPLGTATTDTFRALVLPLIHHPVPLADGRRLSYGDAITGTVKALYNPGDWPNLRQGLTELTEGRARSLMTLADRYEGRDPDGGYDEKKDAFTAIGCVDDVPVTDPAVQRDADRRYRAAAPFRDDGNGPDPARDPCAFWPAPPSSEPHRPHAPGLPPVLVVAVTGDPATPHQAGVKLAAALDARLLTVRGTQHTVALDGIPCVDDIVGRYLVDLTLPAPDTTCATPGH